MGTILLIRHGETIWKSMCITQGQLDSPLTENGIKQAEQKSIQLKCENVEAIFSSPLGRAIKTAEIICKKLELQEIIKVDELKERYEGAFEGLSRNDQIDKYPYLFDDERKLIDIDNIPFAEPIQKFQERVKTAIERIKNAGNKKSLVVTHSGVIQAVNVIFGKMNQDDFGRKSVGLLEMSRFEL